MTRPANRPRAAICLVAICAGAVTVACGAGATPAPAADAGADATAGGCTSANLACDPLGPFPATLAETGVWPAPPSAIAYLPAPELYSNGLHKDRFLLLPPGTRVDNRDRQRWDFPVGALFVKTFYDEAGPTRRRAIETRFIRRTAARIERFEYAVYRWSDDGSRADRLDIAGNNRTPTTVTIAGRTLTHTIPSRNDCGECHESNGRLGSDIIGFDEVRLNHRRTPGARPQLGELAEAAVFIATPPTPAATIEDPDPVLARLKRFVFGNCVHCHNGQMNLVDFRPDVFVTNTVGKRPDSPGITPPPGALRVVPGDPENSVIFLQARATNLPLSLRPMPQVGVDVRDLPGFGDELDNMKAWIQSLPRN